MKSKTSVEHKRAVLEKGRLAADLRRATAPMLETLADPTCVESRTVTDITGNEVTEISPLLRASQKMQGKAMGAIMEAFNRLEKRT